MRRRWNLAVGFIINLVLGALFSLSVFYKPIADHYALRAVAPMTLAFSLAILFFAVGMPMGGRLYDRRGPRLPVLLGASLVGAGYVISSFAGSFADFGTASLFYYLGLGLMAGLGTGLAFAVTPANAANWYPEKTGLAVGFTVSGFGFGPVMASYLSTNLMLDLGGGDMSIGVFQTLLVEGFVWFIILASAARVLRKPESGHQTVSTAAGGSAHGLTLAQAVRDTRFYLLWFAFALSSFAGLILIGDAAPIVIQGLDRGGILQESVLTFYVPTFLFVTAVSNGAGRLGWGVLLDRFGHWKSIFLNHALTFFLMVSFAFLFGSGVLPIFVLGVLILFNYGGISPMYPSTTARLFGTRNLGVVYSALFTAWGVAGLAGPYSAGLLDDLTGSYVLPLYLSAALSLVAAVLVAVGSRVQTSASR